MLLRTFRMIPIWLAKHSIAVSILAQNHKLILVSGLQIPNSRFHHSIWHYSQCSPFSSIGHTIPNHVFDINANITLKHNYSSFYLVFFKLCSLWSSSLTGFPFQRNHRVRAISCQIIRWPWSHILNHNLRVSSYGGRLICCRTLINAPVRLINPFNRNIITLQHNPFEGQWSSVFLTPLHNSPMGSITIGGIAGHGHPFTQLCNIDRTGFDGEDGWLLDNDLDQRRWSISAKDVEWSAGIASGMGLVDFLEVETAVWLVEHSLRL